MALRMRSRAELLSAHDGEAPSRFDFDGLEKWRRGDSNISTFVLKLIGYARSGQKLDRVLPFIWRKIRA